MYSWYRIVLLIGVKANNVYYVLVITLCITYSWTALYKKEKNLLTYDFIAWLHNIVTFLFQALNKKSHQEARVWT